MSNEINLNAHFKNGNYIISVNDSVGSALKRRFIKLQDSLVFKSDTIDLQLTNKYWTRAPITRELRKCFEKNEVKIYSLSTSKYLYTIRRTVPKSNWNENYRYYLYTEITEGDTILYSFSLDAGTPPF